jgi:hypothetical protein
MMNGEILMRGGHETHVRLGQGVPFSEPSAKGATMGARPGILIFSRRRE